MGLPQRVTKDALDNATMDALQDSFTPLNLNSANSNANAFIPISRPSSPLPSSPEVETAAFDAAAYEMEDPASPSTSEGSDDSLELGKGICEHWKEGTFNTAIYMFKLDLSSEWVFLYLRSMHKNEKIKLHHVVRFRAFWEKLGRKDAVNDM